MKKLLLLLLFPVLANAADATLTWVLPTTNTDGSAIPATGQTALASIRIEHFQCAALTTPWPATPTSVTVPMPATTRTLTGFTAGLRYCFRVYAVNNAGNESVPSATGDKLMPVPTPNAPTFTIATTAPTAYRMRQSVDGFQLVALGTVPLGTACDAGNNVNGYSVIPRSAVVPNSRLDTLPLVVFAQCG